MTPTQLADVLARNRITPKGIIHYGGVGDEIEVYERMGFKRILIVQPDIVSLDQIRVKNGTRPHVLGVQCYLGEENGYRLSGETLTPVSRLDSLLVELRQHPKDFNVFQASEGMNTAHGRDQVEEYLEIVGDHVNPKPRVLHLWQKPHGRFANELFQYFFARLLADAHGMELRTPPWAGQRLFGIGNPLLERELPTLEEHDPQPDKSGLWGALRHEPFATAPSNVCLFGNFQFHTGLWMERERERFRHLFSPGPIVGTALEIARRKMVGDHTLVAIHLLRGDYSAGSPGPFYTTPVESYKKWLAEIWPLLHNPMLYVASDDPLIFQQFAKYEPRTSAHMAVSISERFYVDFWVLTQANALAISNSSFSFAAAMLNEAEFNLLNTFSSSHSTPIHVIGDAKPDRFVRPLRDGTMRAFDPWNDDVLLGRYDAPMFGVDTSGYVPGAGLVATVSTPVQKSSEDVCLEHLSAILPKVDPNHEGAFIEVGLGTFAWFFEYFSAKGWQCHAVEPMPTPQLERSCSAFRTSLATAVMGGRDGHAVLRAGRTPDLNSTVPGWWGEAPTLNEKGEAPANRFEVKSMKYGTFLNYIPQKKVTCLKIDVEGAEWEVISGITPENAPAVIMFEYGGTPQKDHKGGWARSAVNNTGRCLEHLAGMGYREIIVVEAGGPPLHSPIAEACEHLDRFIEGKIDHVFKGADYGNIIAIREESES